MRKQHRFGVSQPLSLGVEEELLLVDGDGELTCAAEDVLEGVAGTPIASQVSVEIFTEQFELKTGICRDAGEAFEQLRELRVGMPDPEAAVRLTNALRLYLPALQALSANSPFQEGVDSGHASARTQVVRSYPRFQVPRAFRDYADFLEVADQLVAAAGVDDYTYIWWDVRPHPRLGTVEVRAVDVPTEPGTSAGFAALIQAIAAKELDQPTGSRLHREALEESYFQAASHGFEAEILFDSEQPGPARDVATRMLEGVRPYARELGGEEALGAVDRILREGNGAEEQRRVEHQVGIKGLLVTLIERSAG
jgi:glutamate---cysteine ligase / carboxylate-amine ligase